MVLRMWGFPTQASATATVQDMAVASWPLISADLYHDPLYSLAIDFV